MPQDDNRFVFRSTIGWVWFGIAAFVSAYLIVDMVVRASAWDAFLVAPWLLAICWVVWVFQVVPRIDANERGVRLYNLLRIVDLPWAAVSEVRLRYSTEFDLRAGGTVVAWGGSSRRLHRSIKRRSEEDPAESEAEALQRLHAQAGRGPSEVGRTWEWFSVASAIVIVAWLVFSLLMTRGIILPG